MDFPLVSEYIEAIKSANKNFKELSFLCPVLDSGNLPIMVNKSVISLFLFVCLYLKIFLI